MSHFCKYCGNKLEDGEVCTCSESVAALGVSNPAPEVIAQQPAPQCVPSFEQQMPQQQFGQQYAPQQYGYVAQPQAPSAFSRWMDNIKAFFKAPATVARDAVLKRQFKPGLIFMGITSVLMGFISLILGAKVNGFLDSFSILSSLSSAVGAKINLAAVFFSQAISCFALLCLFALFIMLFAKCFKCNMAYTHALAATGMASAIAAPFLVLAILFEAISPIISVGFIFVLLLIALAIIAGLFVAIEAIKDDKYLTNNNAVYVVFFAFTAVLLCLLLLNYITTFSKLAALGGSLSGAKSLSSLF